jgi:hypothetical protein
MGQVRVGLMDRLRLGDLIVREPLDLGRVRGPSPERQGDPVGDRRDLVVDFPGCWRNQAMPA